MIAKHPAYWKVKAAFLEFTLGMRDAEAHAAKVEQARVAAFTAAGLDPAKRYQMIDAEESITEVEAPDGA